MPFFTAQNQCYMLPSGFWVLGEIARAEPIGNAPPYFYPQSDEDMQGLVSYLVGVVAGNISLALQNGRFLVCTDDESDTATATLSAIQNQIGGVTTPANFVGATWPAGGTPYTVTADEGLEFTESDREAFEVAIGKAMEQTGLYYDVDSVTRYADTLTVTLDESQKPYDAGWDSVLALVADWYGGELP